MVDITLTDSQEVIGDLAKSLKCAHNLQRASKWIFGRVAYTLSSGLVLVRVRNSSRLCNLLPRILVLLLHIFGPPVSILRQRVTAVRTGEQRRRWDTEMEDLAVVGALVGHELWHAQRQFLRDIGTEICDFADHLVEWLIFQWTMLEEFGHVLLHNIDDDAFEPVVVVGCCGVDFLDSICEAWSGPLTLAASLELPRGEVPSLTSVCAMHSTDTSLTSVA